MNRAAKLGRKSSPETLNKKSETARKTKPSPRNPLKDLNGGASLPLSRSSIEAQRGGCLRFLLPSSSSKECTFGSSRSLIRTPKSAPPNPRTLPSKKTNPSKIRSSRNADNHPSRASSESLKKLGSQKLSKPKNSDLLQRWNRTKPSSEGAPAGKNTDSDLTFDAGLEGNGGQVGILRPASCLATTPEKTLSGSSPNVGSETKEGEQKLSNTPASATTPPIQPSVSPEILNGSMVAPTPVCFAAGHLITGIQDRRKCRPRGILTIGGAGMEVMENSASGCSNGSRISSAVPPLAEASMHWLSSPSEYANGGTSGSSCCKVRKPHCPDEASVDWLLSPHDDDADEGILRSNRIKASAWEMGDKLSSNHGILRLSPSNSNTSGLMGPILETPSSVYGIRRTPTSGSSISPFSAILQRTAALSGLMDVRPHQQRGGYRYGSTVENSPFSGESWGDGNVILTPSSYSSSKKQSTPPFEMDSVAEALRSMSMSPQPVLISDASFQFMCPAPPLNSIDQVRIQRSYDKMVEPCLNKQGLPDVTISWRGGLLSRMFEMGELDRCSWLSDDEEDRIESKFDFKFDPSNCSSILKEGNEEHAHGFGSFEFSCDKVATKKGDEKITPPGLISCAESISTDGGDGLNSSGDSDWTLFYRNHLFEMQHGGYSMTTAANLFLFLEIMIATAILSHDAVDGKQNLQKDLAQPTPMI